MDKSALSESIWVGNLTPSGETTTTARPQKFVARAHELSPFPAIVALGLFLKNFWSQIFPQSHSSTTTSDRPIAYSWVDETWWSDLCWFWFDIHSSFGLWQPPFSRSKRRMARVEDYNPLMDRRSPVRLYRSYQEHKKCRKVLKNVTWTGGFVDFFFHFPYYVLVVLLTFLSYFPY